MSIYKLMYVHLYSHEIWTDGSRSRIKDNAEVFKKFMFGIKPLAKEGRLGCVLVQFPYYFYPSMTNFKYILRCKEYLSGVSTVIEFEPLNHLKAF